MKKLQFGVCLLLCVILCAACGARPQGRPNEPLVLLGETAVKDSLTFYKEKPYTGLAFTDDKNGAVNFVNGEAVEIRIYYPDGKAAAVQPLPRNAADAAKAEMVFYNKGGKKVDMATFMSEDSNVMLMISQLEQFGILPVEAWEEEGDSIQVASDSVQVVPDSVRVAP